MTSTLIIYKSCRIREEKLFIVDDIASYLDTLTKQTITAFQYQRQGMSLKIKINKKQTALNFTEANDYNYASIQNDSEKVCYYFIKNKKQLADSTIELELSMDTINTFRPTTDFEISERTKVNREHKNRVKVTYESKMLHIRPDDYNVYDELPSVNEEVWIYPDGDSENIFARGILKEINYRTDDPTIVEEFVITLDEGYTSEMILAGFEQCIYYEIPAILKSIDEDLVELDVETLDNIVFTTSGTRYLRDIDINSEGLTPLLYGTNKGVLNGDGQSWYLIYRGNNPLSCYLCADNGFTATMQSTNKEIVATDLVVGTYYYILPDRNGNPRQDINVSLETAEGNNVSATIFSSGSGNMTYKVQYVTYYYRDGANIKVGRYYYLNLGAGFFYVSTLTLYTTTKIIIKDEKSPIKGNTLGTLTNNTATIRGGTSFDINLTTSQVEVYDITSVNRTDADIAKIIKLPYKPCDDNFTGWAYDSDKHMLVLKNLDKPLESYVSTTYDPFEDLKIEYEVPVLTANRKEKWESKLFHSDYYQPKFVYDSFTFVFALERQKEYVTAENFLITFTATGTINSRFLFTFVSYNVDDYCLEDYSNILPVARNNEVPIYNSDYINYIKMGFNYDVKTKQRQEAGQWIGTALSLVGSIASFASSSVTGGFGIAGGISLATATLGQMVNAVNSTAQAEANQAQKLYQLRQQKESVMGSDDIDLMSKYTNNKAKWMLYKVSARMKSVLLDLFHYTGYIDGTSKVPNVTTRKWFNFLSCDLVVNEDNNINGDIMNDIKAKYALGVTFMHCNTIVSVKTWDWNQEKENWETILFN